MENPLIKDLPALFRASGMVDQLRDSALLLYQRAHKIQPSHATLADMVGQYTRLRSDLAKVVAEDVAAEIEAYTKALDPKAVTADEIWVQAAALARIADLAHQTPKFLFSEKVASQAVEEFEEKNSDDKKRKGDDDRAGMYV